MKIVFLLVGSLRLAISPLSAQSPSNNASVSAKPLKPELPSAPLLRSAAEFSQWQIDFVYPEDTKKEKLATTSKAVDPAADARPRKILVTKTVPIIHEAEIDVLNRLKDVWFKGPTQYTKNNVDPVWYQTNPGMIGDSGYRPLPPSGFRDLDWITAGNYAGIVPYGNGQCLVFTPGGYQKLDLSEPAERAKRIVAAKTIAYVDADTRMPVAVQTVSEIRIYHFGPPPTQMQTLPPDLAEQIAKGNEGRAQLNRPAARPY